MDAQGAFDELSPEQQERITALITELEGRPTGEALVTCLQLRGIDLNSEAGIAQCDEVMRSAEAFERLKPYVNALRYFNAERDNIGRRIHELNRHPYPTNKDEVLAKAQADLLAAELSGMQEVMFHYFCISAKHVLSYLNITAEAAGHTLPEEDQAFLDHYRDLRDHYEHYYNRLPGKVHADTVFERTVNGVEYRVRGGLRVDEQGRLILKMPEKEPGTKKNKLDAAGNPVMVDRVFDVTNRGMDQINDIVERNWAEIRRKAFDRVRDHFVQNPENIPSPEDVPSEMLTKPAGFVPQDR